MAGSGGGPGLFMVAWGTFATGFGWIVATDFRHAAQRFLLMSERAMPFGTARAPRVSVGFVRALAGVFAVVGPLVLVNGIRILVSDGTGLADDPLPALPAPMVAVSGGIVVFWTWALWRRAGWFRREWAHGGGLQRAAVAVLSVVMAGFPTALALGSLTAALVVWMAGVPAVLILLVSGRSAPGSE